MTYNQPESKGKKFALPALFLLFLSLSLFTMNCADDPTSLGLKFLPSGETTGVRIFDSRTDTLAITSYSVKHKVNTYFSTNLIVGKQGNYSSKALIKFINLPSDKGTAFVSSAVLRLRYRNYFYPPIHSDSLGQISFEVYKVIQNLNLSTITLDSVSSSSFGTVSKGTYTGIPADDSEEVFINLDTTMVKDWLKYAADPNYSVPNYGIVLSPNTTSNVLKGFFSVWNGSAVAPQVTIIYTISGVRDTMVHNVSENVFLADGDNTPPQGEFYLQAGISYDQVMKFDIGKSNIPSTATINDVQVMLYENPDHSLYSKQTIYGINSAFVTDSVGTKNEGFPAAFSATGFRNVYTLRLIAPFQRWLNGTTNHGMFIIPSNQTSNLDRFAFYNENASDLNKRPRVIIKYTPRAAP